MLAAVIVLAAGLGAWRLAESHKAEEFRLRVLSTMGLCVTPPPGKDIPYVPAHRLISGKRP